MFNKNLFIIALLLITVTGCTQLSVETPRTGGVKTPVIKPTTKESAWKQRQQFVNKKAAWNLNAKISVRFDDENWIFGLTWAQKNQQQYAMQIKNPLTGAVVAKVARDASGVSLLASDGKVYRDNDEERLLQRQSGLTIPLKGMKHWVRGVSSPLYKVDKVVLDALGRPLFLYQADWKIAYLKYLNTSFNAMPRKVVITRAKDALYLKMIVKKWQGI